MFGASITAGYPLQEAYLLYDGTLNKTKEWLKEEVDQEEQDIASQQGTSEDRGSDPKRQRVKEEEPSGLVDSMYANLLGATVTRALLLMSGGALMMSWTVTSESQSLTGRVVCHWNGGNRMK